MYLGYRNNNKLFHVIKRILSLLKLSYKSELLEKLLNNKFFLLNILIIKRIIEKSNGLSHFDVCFR